MKPNKVIKVKAKPGDKVFVTQVLKEDDSIGHPTNKELTKYFNLKKGVVSSIIMGNGIDYLIDIDNEPLESITSHEHIHLTQDDAIKYMLKEWRKS